MHKKVLVCLPLNDAHRAALEASVPEFEFRFNALDDVLSLIHISEPTRP